jgi:hypothetical protein
MKRIVPYHVPVCSECGGHVEFECLECKRVFCGTCVEKHDHPEIFYVQRGPK